jgi:hypothetical protein
MYYYSLQIKLGFKKKKDVWTDSLTYTKLGKVRKGEVVRALL